MPARIFFPSPPLEALLDHLPPLAFWGPVLWFVPLFGGRHLPAPARLALALSLALVVSSLPDVGPGPVMPGPPLAAIAPALALHTVALFLGGLVTALLLRMPFDLLRGVGAAAAAARGTPASWAGLSPAGDRGAPLALALELCLLAAAAPLGLDHRALRLSAVVLGSIEGSLERHGLELGAGLQSLGPSPLLLGTWFFASLLALALPFLLAAWLLDAALGSIGRLLPQLPVFFLAQPLKALLIALLVAACAPQLVEAGALAMDEVGEMIEDAP